MCDLNVLNATTRHAACVVATRCKRHNAIDVRLPRLKLRTQCSRARRQCASANTEMWSRASGARAHTHTHGRGDARHDGDGTKQRERKRKREAD